MAALVIPAPGMTSSKSLARMPSALAPAGFMQHLIRQWLVISLPACRGFRERLLADPGFMIKVAIEVGIGICTKSTAEYTKRGQDFKNELDFVLANVIM